MNQYLKQFLDVNEEIIEGVFMITDTLGERLAYIFLSANPIDSTIHLLAESACAEKNSIEVMVVSYAYDKANHLRGVVGDGIEL